MPERVYPLDEADGYLVAYDGQLKSSTFLPGRRHTTWEEVGDLIGGCLDSGHFTLAGVDFQKSDETGKIVVVAWRHFDIMHSERDKEVIGEYDVA